MVNMEAVASKPTLVGERLRLVPLAPQHAEALYVSTLDEESRRLTGTHKHFTPDEIERWCATRAEQGDRLDLAVEAIDTGEFIGDLSLNGIDVDNESGGFRIALVPGYLGKGYGPEATRLLLRYAFDEVSLHRVHLEVFEFNERAFRSYEKCGFVLEGRMRQSLRWDGEWHDTLIMAALRAG